VICPRASIQYRCLPLCCRPLYQYEGTNPPPTSAGPVVQSGFPTAAAINLSVKCIAAASTGMKPLPLPLPLPLTRSPGTMSVMDLSTSSVTSTSPQVRFVSLMYLGAYTNTRNIARIRILLLSRYFYYHYYFLYLSIYGLQIKTLL
jgi:hypothetical protein